MAERTCTTDGCNKPLKARGLCGTHYNQTLPNRHKKVMVTCDGCGKLTPKESRSNRYVGTYCSLLCRDYVRWGSQSSTLPADHWARLYGATCRWVAPLTTQRCRWCDVEYQPIRITNDFCSRGCKKRQYKATRKGREHNAPGTYSWAEIVRLWQAFDKRCAYCSRLTPLADIQAEHVTPLSRGGANNLTNLLPSCGPCNSDKRDLYLSDWNSDRARRGLEPRNTSWQTDDPRFRHLVQGGMLAA